jgi:hypothetical protein
MRIFHLLRPFLPRTLYDSMRFLDRNQHLEDYTPKHIFHFRIVVFLLWAQVICWIDILESRVVDSGAF